MATEFPTLSHRERDRRWSRTRRFLEQRDLACLVMCGFKGRERYEGYLSNDNVDGLVIFPIDGTPIHQTWGAHRITRRMAGNVRRDLFWIDDIRVGPYGPGIVEAIRERNLASKRIGVVGLDSKGPAEFEGIMPYRVWEHVLANLPDTEFVDVSDEYSTLMLTKSEEEIALYRFAADIGEKACERMLELVRPGIDDAELFSEIMYLIHRHNAMSVAPHLIISVGADDVGWGQPYWQYTGGSPRVVQKGDVVQAEIFPCYGGVETQQQMSVAVQPVPGVHRQLAEVAREAYERGLATLKPGITFGELNDAMFEPVKRERCWNLTPLIHSLGPLSLVSTIGHDIEQMPGLDRYRGVRTVPCMGAETVIEASMIFAFEPNACRGNNRVNIGGTILVTETGCEELNRLPNEMHVVQ